MFQLLAFKEDFYRFAIIKLSIIRLPIHWFVKREIEKLITRILIHLAESGNLYPTCGMYLADAFCFLKVPKFLTFPSSLN